MVSGCCKFEGFELTTPTRLRTGSQSNQNCPQVMTSSQQDEDALNLKFLIFVIFTHPLRLILSTITQTVGVS